MPWSSEHIKWLTDTGERIETSDGRVVEVWEFAHDGDEAILASWAKHFRNHYCLDEEIEFYRNGTGLSRSGYLNEIKFPDKAAGFGPGIRAGDFGEILVADYLQYRLDFWVPRTRYGDKTVRNESTKGSDIIGFKFMVDGQESPDDILAIYEAKTQFSGNAARPRLQDAVDDSAKDYARKAESLNAIKQRLFQGGHSEQANLIDRFQNLQDRPYSELYGAAALFSDMVFDAHSVSETDSSGHPNNANLVLLVIHGVEMMKLVHDLYQRAADEA